MTTNKVGRPAKAKDELVNTFVDECVSYLIPKFEALVPEKQKNREKGAKGNPGWRKLSAETARLMMTVYPDNKPDDEKEYTTCWNQIANLKRELDRGATTHAGDSANTTSIKTIIKHFTNALYQVFSPYRQNTAKRYKEQVAVRSLPENRKELDLSKFVKQAVEVLEATKDDTLLKITWEDVSCALALATGRRMAEIHLSAEFQPVEGDEYAVMFTGQLKGKDRKAVFDNGRLVDTSDGKDVRYVPFIIPTVVKAELVISGLNYLKENGKRLAKSEDTTRVNARYSKALSGKVKANWDFIPNPPTPKEGTSYHKFRAAYFLLCLVNKEVNPMDALDYITILLGDTSKDAQDAYKRFNIKPGSITRI